MRAGLGYGFARQESRQNLVLVLRLELRPASRIFFFFAATNRGRAGASPPALPPPSPCARKQTRRLRRKFSQFTNFGSHCAACRGGLRFLKNWGKEPPILLKIAGKTHKTPDLDESAKTLDKWFCNRGVVAVF